MIDTSSIDLEAIDFRDPPAFRMLAITDMHIGDSGLRTPEQDTLDLTLRNIDILQPDIVVNAGDVVKIRETTGNHESLNQSGDAKKDMLTCWELYAEHFSKRCPAPLLDVCLEGDKPYWAETRGIGFSHGYANEHARFIALCLEDDVRIRDSLLAELETHATACGGTLVVATHYPVEGTCVRDTVHWVRQSAQLKQLIASHCRRGILIAGHWHDCFHQAPAQEGNAILCFGGQANTLSDNADGPWGKVIDCHEDTVTVSHWDFASQTVTQRHVLTQGPP